jgi:predicted O-methyltransferase YrrM
LNYFFTIRAFITYFLAAKTRYQLHSPFVFALAEAIFEDDRSFYAFQEIESYRKQLLDNQQLIEVTDLGAGSKTGATKRRKIADITGSAASSPRDAQVLFRLINFLKPRNIVELGTSMGIATAYFSRAALNSRLITLEGCPNIAAQARQNLDVLQVKNAQIIVGNFSDTLPKILQNIDYLDVIYMDGNHAYQPTMDYFALIAHRLTEQSVVILDDIYWSPEMAQAWEALKKHPKVTLSIDIFTKGFLFFRKENLDKEHFQLVPSTWKIWQRFLP